MDLALTLDYELFGDGSGNIFDHIIDPTDKLIKICNQYNAKITIFFEVVEYWKIKECWLSGQKMGYENDPIQAIEKQLVEAYALGHDVQLHIHPQWINAKYNGKKWIVSEDWCMKDIPLHKNKFYDTNLKEVLKRSKNTLEEILKPHFPEYNCNIFRAGGFNILPSEEVIRVLKDLNFKMDSSVYAGGFDISSKSNIDYRKVKNNVPFWTISKYNVLEMDKNKSLKNKFYEIPIFSDKIIRLFKYDFSRINILLKNKNSARKTLVDRVEKKSVAQKIKFLFEYEYITWDFCLFSVKKMRKFLNKARLINKNSNYHPFVLIGHSKGFYSSKALRFLIENQDLKFVTLSKILKKIHVSKLNGK